MFSFMLANLISLQDLADLPLRVATVVAGRLNADFDLDVRVDPPNDLTIGGRKLAGTLCQSHLRGTDISWVVCGIGLNTNLSRDQIQVPGSTSLLIESGYRVDHEQLLGSLLEVLAPIRAS